MTEVRNDDRRALGAHGEDAAVRFLQRAGLVVLERNWRCRAGEIDIVALDDKASTLVIVEVKTRRSTAFGSPIEAVTVAKAARLRRLAAAWLAAHPIGVRDVRIDVVGILVDRSGYLSIEHVEGVL